MITKLLVNNFFIQLYSSLEKSRIEDNIKYRPRGTETVLNQPYIKLVSEGSEVGNYKNDSIAQRSLYGIHVVDMCCFCFT